MAGVRQRDDGRWEYYNDGDACGLKRGEKGWKTASSFDDSQMRPPRAARGSRTAAKASPVSSRAVLPAGIIVRLGFCTNEHRYIAGRGEKRLHPARTRSAGSETPIAKYFCSHIRHDEPPPQPLHDQSSSNPDEPTPPTHTPSLLSFSHAPFSRVLHIDRDHDRPAAACAAASNASAVAAFTIITCTPHR